KHRHHISPARFDVLFVLYCRTRFRPCERPTERSESVYPFLSRLFEARRLFCAVAIRNWFHLHSAHDGRYRADWAHHARSIGRFEVAAIDLNRLERFRNPPYQFASEKRMD